MNETKNSVDKLFYLYSKGRVDFCEATEKFIELYVENDVSLLNKYLDVLRKANAHEILQCFNSVADVIMEMNSSLFLKCIKLLVNKIGLTNTKKMLNSYFAESDLAEIYLENKLQDINEVENLDEIITMLELFHGYFSNEALKLIEKKVKTKGLEITPKLDANRLSILGKTDSLHGEIDTIIESLQEKDLTSIGYLLLTLQNIILYSDYRDKEGILRSLQKISNLNINKLVTSIPSLTFQKDVLDALIWLLPYTNLKPCVDQIFRIVDVMVKNGILINFDLVSDSVTNCKDAKIDLLIKRLNNLSRDADWRKRLFAVNLLGKILKKGFNEPLSLLVKLCRDKRSIIRKTAGSYLIEYIEGNDEVSVKVLMAVIRSEWTDGIAKILEIFTHRKCKKDKLELLIKSSFKIPRSKVINSLLNLIEAKWREIRLPILIEALRSVIKFSVNKKRMMERTINVLKTIINNVNNEDREFILKNLLKNGVPESARKMLINL